MLTQMTFQATAVDAEPLTLDMDALRAQYGEDTPPAEALPVASLLLRSGPNVVVQVSLSTQDASGLLDTFRQVQAARESATLVEWDPQPPAVYGMTMVLVPEVTDFELAAPAPELSIPYWALSIREESGNEIQMLISDALVRDIVRTLDAMSRNEIR